MVKKETPFPSFFDATFLRAEKVFETDRLLERLILRFFPPWILPNHLTLTRMLATPPTVYLLMRGSYEIGIPLFLLVAFTDALDGALARTRNQITHWGMLFDPLADKLLIISTLLVLIFSHLDILVASTIIGIELLIVILALIWRKQGGMIQSNVWGKAKMILQVLAILVLLVGAWTGLPVQGVATGLFFESIGCAIMSIVNHGI